MSSFEFIPPSVPCPRDKPPAGPGWLHELKFDGFRIQIHRLGRDVALYTRQGFLAPKRFQLLHPDILSLPASSFVLDGELVACDEFGRPDFPALMRGQVERACIYAFDLLRYKGRDVRALPLHARRDRLETLLRSATSVAPSSRLRLSETFVDAERLLQASEGLHLEGIVSKKADQPYVSGKNIGWVKVKTDLRPSISSRFG